MGVKEKALTAASSIASGDFLRMVTSAGAARKIDYSKLAKAIVEEYNGSTIAGSAQTLKVALDSLNSKINGGSWVNISDSPVAYCKRGGMVIVKITNATAGTTWTELATLPSGYTPNASITAAGAAGSNGRLHMGVTIGTNGLIQASCEESTTNGYALVVFPV